MRSASRLILAATLACAALGGALVGASSVGAQETAPAAVTTYHGLPLTSPLKGAEVSRAADGRGFVLTIADASARAQQVKVTLVLDRWDPVDQRIQVTLRGKTASGAKETKDGDGWKEVGSVDVKVPVPGTIEIPVDGAPKDDATFWFGYLIPGTADLVQHRTPPLGVAAIGGGARAELDGSAGGWFTDQAGAATGYANTGRAATMRVSKERFVLVVPNPMQEIGGKQVTKVTDAIVFDPGGAGTSYRMEVDSQTKKVRVVDDATGTRRPSGSPFEADLGAQAEGLSTAVVAQAKLAQVVGSKLPGTTLVTVTRTVELADGSRAFTQSATATLSSFGASSTGTTSGTNPSGDGAGKSSSGISLKKVAAGGAVVALLGGIGVWQIVIRRNERQRREAQYRRPRPGQGSADDHDEHDDEYDSPDEPGDGSFEPEPRA